MTSVNIRLLQILAAASLMGLGGEAMAAAPQPDDAYFATVDVRRGAASDRTAVTGVVFDDANRNGRHDRDERGVAGVKVSNGREVSVTGPDGGYALPVRADMAVFVVQPSGWRVPTDRRFVPQFAYQHKPAGSPRRLRYGGLPATGPLPSAINFPLARSNVGKDFGCAVLGDVQVYSGDEIGYARDSIVRELRDRPVAPACILALGDLVGDDLGLLPRIAEVLGAVRVPQWWVQGNHDYDSDADRDVDSSDTWRRSYGPSDYAFEIGDVLFIALDNVRYPCGTADNAGNRRPFCVEYVQKSYTGRISADQLAFVANLVKATSRDKLVVVAHHIPLVGFDNARTWAHQTLGSPELYAILQGRRALDLSGHSHTLENLAAGDSFDGWREMVDVKTIPFRHVVAGAVAGDWWGGDYDIAGIPMSIQGDGAPRGWLDMAVAGTDYRLDYRATGLSPDKAMWLSVNTPAFRDWTRTLLAWRDADKAKRGAVPPLSAHDLPDGKLLTPADLAGGSWLTANIWMGDSMTRVDVTIDGGPPQQMTRTQEARGEPSRNGPEFADPFVLPRQLTVARAAIQSRSGQVLAQGFAQGKEKTFVPTPPQPRGSVADHSAHVWRLRLPASLAPGVHTATVSATRAQGSPGRETLVFEVRAERPPRKFRWDAWDAFTDGPRLPD